MRSALLAGLFSIATTFSTFALPVDISISGDVYRGETVFDDCKNALAFDACFTVYSSGNCIEYPVHAPAKVSLEILEAKKKGIPVIVTVKTESGTEISNNCN